jgi:pyruvate/2-oxoglutarate dehydrogenase complex dihydrolipoamide acyltransferase (E2) component
MSETTPVAVPRENVNDETATLVSWYVQSGQHVDRGQHIAQIETSKATLEIEAPVSGIVQYTIAAGAEVAIGAVICHIGDGAPAAEIPPASTTAQNGEAPAPPLVDGIGNVGTEAHATGAARAAKAEFRAAAPPPPQSTRFSRKATELIQQLGLDAAQFEGRGLVRSQDILRTLEPAETSQPEAAQPAPTRDEGRGAAQTAATGVSYHSQRLPRAKRTEARAIRTAHEATLPSAVSVACRTLGLRAALEEHASLGASATSIIVFEAARLLRKYPVFNAFYTDDQIHYYDDVNVGFAVDADRGLKVLVIRHADRKTIAEIAEEMRELVVGYLGDELPVAALAGGTFTVSDLSGEGVFGFQPLINRGQAAILGVGGEVFLPGAREGIFNLVLTFDHQLAEGRTAARFLNDLRQRLEFYEASLLSSVAAKQSSEEPCCVRCRMVPAELEPYGHYLVQTVRAGGASRLMCTRCLRGY